MMVGAMYGVGFGVLASLARIRGMALVTNMAELVGYGTFLAEHLILGLVLGLALFMGAKRAR